MGHRKEATVTANRRLGCPIFIDWSRCIARLAVETLLCLLKMVDIRRIVKQRFDIRGRVCQPQPSVHHRLRAREVSGACDQTMNGTKKKRKAKRSSPRDLGR